MVKLARRRQRLVVPWMDDESSRLYVVIPNDYRKCRCQLQTAWSGFSEIDIDTSPTARMRLFTGTLVCLLIQVVQKNCGVHGARWCSGWVTQDQANVKDSLLCSAAARFLQRKRQCSSDRTWSDSSCLRSLASVLLVTLAKPSTLLSPRPVNRIQLCLINWNSSSRNYFHTVHN